MASERLSYCPLERAGLGQEAGTEEHLLSASELHDPGPAKHRWSASKWAAGNPMLERVCIWQPKTYEDLVFILPITIKNKTGGGPKSTS